MGWFGTDGECSCCDPVICDNLPCYNDNSLSSVTADSVEVVLTGLPSAAKLYSTDGVDFLEFDIASGFNTLNGTYIFDRPKTPAMVQGQSLNCGAPTIDLLPWKSVGTVTFNKYNFAISPPACPASLLSTATITGEVKFVMNLYFDGTWPIYTFRILFRSFSGSGPGFDVIVGRGVMPSPLNTCGLVTFSIRNRNASVDFPVGCDSLNELWTGHTIEPIP